MEKEEKYIRCAGCHKKIVYEFGVSLCNECEEKIYQNPTSFEETPDKIKKPLTNTQQSIII